MAKVGGKGLTRITLGVVGVDALVAKLKQLPGETRKKVLTQALRKGALAVKKIMKAEAPKGPTGNLKKSIVIKKMKGKGIAYVVRPSYAKSGSAAHLVEYGTGQRTVANYFGHKGVEVDVGFVAANPFVQRTRDRAKTQVFNIAVKESKARLSLLGVKGGKRG